MSAYRPIVPRYGPPPAPHEPTRKRKRGQIACNACREKKTGCDNQRPICRACIERGSSCEYITKDSSETRITAIKRENAMLRESNAALEELVSALRYAPDDVALQVFRTLRTSSDPLSVLNRVKGNGRVTEPEFLRTISALLPPLGSKLELELVRRHPFAYPLVDLSKNAIASRTTLVEPTLTPSSADRPALNEDSERRPFRPNYALYLRDLDISFWTAVPISNEFARGVLSSYLETDHLILGLFDAELFLDDLVNMRLGFCSPLLVSALLAWASQAYGWEDPQAALQNSHDFLREAENLWRVENTDSLPRIAAAILLFECLGGQGQGKRSTEYLDQASQMGRRMKLFGVPDALRDEDIKSLSKNHRRATAHVAWGVFNHITMPCLFYVTTPTEHPPALPVPGSSWPGDSTKRGDPPTVAPVSTNTFTYFCHLWTIASEVLYVYRHDNVSQPTTPAFALSRYYRMLALASILPNSMARRQGAPSHVLIFHIWYHAIMVDIFRPFTSPNTQQHDFQFPASSGISAELISSVSVRQLQSLIFEYSERPQGSTTFTLFWHAALLYVANASLATATTSLADTDWRFYFLLCLKNYQTLFPVFGVAEEIVQGLLGIAISKGALSALEARALINEFRNTDTTHGGLETRKSGFIIALDLALVNEEAAKVDTLAEGFQDAAIFDEFTEDAQFPTGTYENTS